MYALNGHGFFLPIRCNNFGMVHYIYIEGSQLIIAKLNSISFSVHPFFILVANSIDPDEMRLHCLANETHLCPISINGSSIFVRKKIFARQLSPQIGPFIFFHNVCMREVKSHLCGGSVLRGSPLR